MKIKQALFTAGYSSFYFDDQQAIKNGAGHDGFFYTGEPVTQGFNAVRQAGECVSVQLILENGAVAVGDCAAVQYSGAGGRDPLFLAEHFIPFLNDHIKPLLVGRDVDAFLPNARFFDKLRIDGNLLHTAVRYGLSQALLLLPRMAIRRIPGLTFSNAVERNQHLFQITLLHVNISAAFPLLFLFKRLQNRLNVIFFHAKQLKTAAVFRFSTCMRRRFFIRL